MKQLTTEQYQEKLSNHETTRLAKGTAYRGSRTAIKHVCIMCGVEFMARPENAVRHAHNCKKEDVAQFTKDEKQKEEYRKEEFNELCHHLNNALIIEQIEQKENEIKRYIIAWLKISLLVGLLSWLVFSVFFFTLFQSFVLSLPITLLFFLLCVHNDDDIKGEINDIKKLGDNYENL